MPKVKVVGRTLRTRGASGVTSSTDFVCGALIKLRIDEGFDERDDMSPSLLPVGPKPSGHQFHETTDEVGAQHPNCGVWTLNYRAKIYEWRFFSRSRMDLLDRAAWFIEELLRRGVATKPIIFVAHSLGGLIVKQALQFAYSMGGPAWQTVWKQTRAVVFIASPHNGSLLANFADNIARTAGALSRLLLPPSPILQCLRSDWSPLRYLGDWYREHSVEAGIHTLSFSERRAYCGVFVVDANSANPGIPQVMTTPIDENHKDIAKPQLASSSVYGQVGGLLNVIAADANVRKAQSDLVDRICGDWWGRVITRGHESVLACIRIKKHWQTGQPFLHGQSYDLNGAPVAEWKSRFSEVKRSATSNGITFNYVYEGERLDEPDKVLLHGYAEVEFEESKDARAAVQRGSGEFTSVYHAKKATHKAVGTATRRTQKLVRVMQSTEFDTLWTAVNKEQCKRDVHAILGTVWQTAGDEPNS